MAKIEVGIPITLISKLESLMPGEVLTVVTPGGRRFTVIEEEEFNVVLVKAGFGRDRAKRNDDETG